MKAWGSLHREVIRSSRLSVGENTLIVHLCVLRRVKGLDREERNQGLTGLNP